MSELHGRTHAPLSAESTHSFRMIEVQEGAIKCRHICFFLIAPHYWLKGKEPKLTNAMSVLYIWLYTLTCIGGQEGNGNDKETHL